MPKTALTLVLLGCVASLLPAQQRTASTQTPVPEPYRLQVTAQLVLADASVVWKKTGEPIRGLTEQDFLVYDEGELQTLTSLRTESLPLSVVLLFDLTDTVQPVLQHLADGTAAMLRQLHSEDEVAVMTFSSHTRVEQRFTRDPMAAREGLDSASASYERGEPTFLFEDVWEAVQQSEASRLPEARRVQIWVTDGSANDQRNDRARAHTAPQVLHTEAEATLVLLRSGVIVSALLERSSLQGSGRFGDLEHFAEVTGGPVVQATAGDAAIRLAGLLDTLRARYTLGYRPRQPRPSGSFCHLRVELSPAFYAMHGGVRRGEVEVRSQAGYLRGASGLSMP